MPLQNRVDPAGLLHAVAARGLFTGNRGVIHDPATRSLTGRRWTTRAWIICRCDYKDRRREVFGRNGRTGGAGWTNLFFLDEVTALAAGHRPCFECRRAEAIAFAEAFSSPAAKAPEMDAILHRQRLAAGANAVRLSEVEILALPDCAVITCDGRVLARKDDGFREWTFEGYRGGALPTGATHLITPPATVTALRAGYRPVWHPSA
ncbi:MAG: hypothetical protein M9924_02855 [Rhizobiaceae bacterium]|nr:hypothetical protein [Rhizobiaceae bacterium]